MKVVTRRERIAATGGEAVFVVHDEPDLLDRTMFDGLDVPFPVLVDRDRHTYQAWGLTRAPWWRIWLDPAVWRQYAELLIGGERLRQAGRDPRQLGGDFVVAPDGQVVYARPQTRDDRPAAGELVDRLEAVAS